jgi:glycerol-3-phosphate cytidylyltransferase
MKRILTYGTFDTFHWGHVRLLMRARDLGDELHVGVSTDAFNRQKGKQTYLPFAQRKQIVAELRSVTSVFEENSWDQKIYDVQRLSIDVLVMGDDWAGKFDSLRDLCDVIYIPRTCGISSTLVKQIID